MRFFRLTVLLLLLPALAACGSGPPPPPRLAAWFGAPAGGTATPVLVLRVLATEGLTAMTLTAPDGRSFQPVAFSLPDGPAEDDGPWRPGIGLGGSAGSGGDRNIGIGLSLPLGNPFARPKPGWRATQAEFRLGDADLAHYRDRPQDWLVELGFAGHDTRLPAPPVQAGP